MNENEQNSGEGVSESSPTLFSIGHSNHSMEKFLDLLNAHQIEVLVDVRSQPYSRYATHFNKSELKTAIIDHGLKYLFLGKELGGRPESNTDAYSQDSRVDYRRVEEAPLFQEGVERLQKGIEKFRVAMMCSEENPENCHRHLLIGRVLARRGISVRHIRGDGSIQSQFEVANHKPSGDPNYVQPKLIPDEEISEWKSTRPVLPKKTRPNSSGS